MRIVILIKLFINFIMGSLILFLRDELIDYLSYVIAIALFLESLEELIYIFVKKQMILNKDALYAPLARLLIAAILVIQKIFFSNSDQSLIFVCLIWGTVSIFTACKDIALGIYEYKNKIVMFSHLARGLVEIVLAFMLLIDPVEHATFHLIVLGAEFMLEFVDLSFHWLNYKNKKFAVKMDMKAAEEVRKVKDYLTLHPEEEDSIIASIDKSLPESEIKEE